ncbi:hypothetical protein D3C79_1078490 [compost metagenome]
MLLKKLFNKLNLVCSSSCFTVGGLLLSLYGALTTFVLRCTRFTDGPTFLRIGPTMPDFMIPMIAVD